MYIFNSFNYVPLKSVVIDSLKGKGVKYKLGKKSKEEHLNNLTDIGPKIFQVPLQCLDKASIVIKGGRANVEVPQFLVNACTFIEERMATEGIFRKGGSAAKQRELKQLINSGKPFDASHHVIDVCNLLKLFFRELPEPLLPQYCHEMFLSCLLLSGEAAQKEALLLSCLLLQLDHLAALTYFMEFLSKISKAAEVNKMDAKNLAIVFTPSLMPIDSKTKIRSNLTINHHIAVIEMLIKSADELGLVPEPLAKQAALCRPKKRRSASITRMFTGIRKIVGRAPSPPKTETPDTPSATTQLRKRKSSELMLPAVTVKRRKEMAETTPRLCRMGGYSQSSLRISDNRLRDELHSSERRKSQGLCEIDSARVEGDDADKKMKKLVNNKGLKSSKSTSNLMNGKKNLERKLTHMTWRKRRSNSKAKSPEEQTGKEELVTISKKEYDEMKTRVFSMEMLLKEREQDVAGIKMNLESENLAKQFENELKLSANERKSPAAAGDTASTVEAAFQRAVVQSEQLGPQLRKSVRLRWSSEGRVARSPSERKIGSLRRRSRELARSNSANARTNLQRGRPNTRQTGLRSPRELSDNAKRSKVANNNKARQTKLGTSIPMSPGMMKLCETPERRDSIIHIRRNNIGMVHAKAKFFDSLNHSTDVESDRSNRSMESRLQSVRNEFLSRPPAIKPALTTASSQALKTPKSRATPRHRATPLKALPLEMNTPMRDTRRSPRILLSRKTPRV